MRRSREQDEQDEQPDQGGRWQRRAARREAERRRMPKHGKAYVDLAQRMIARRATEATPGAAAPGRKEATRPRPRKAPT